MTTKWTPGPWRLGVSRLVVFTDEFVVAHADPVDIEERFRPEPTACRANARLIASAPDLYEHSKALLESIWDGVIDRETLPPKARDAIEGLTAALAKARGEA